MEPGKELDYLIAEHVFECEWHSIAELQSLGFSSVLTPKDEFFALLPKGWKPPELLPGYNILNAIVSSYSTDISSAWKIIEKMFSLGYDTEIQGYLRTDVYHGPSYRVTIAKIDRQQDSVVEFSNSAPHAICIAALKILGFYPNEK